MATIPIKYNLSLHQGDTWINRAFIWKQDGVAVDLTGYAATLVLKSNPQNAVVHTFTSGGSELAITALEGRVDLNVPKSTTADVPAGVYFYDIFVDDGAVRRTLAYGKFTVTDEAS